MYKNNFKIMMKNILLDHGKQQLHQKLLKSEDTRKINDLIFLNKYINSKMINKFFICRK